MRQVEEKVRTLSFAAEQLHQAKLPDESPVLKWAVLYSGQIMSRAHRFDIDRRIAYETRRGRGNKRPLSAEKR